MFKAYASYFVSYLLMNLKDKENIDKVILFGSVAKNETNKNSDIDIFIDLKKENLKIKKEIENLLSKFYTSREALLFKTKGIDNKINLIVGRLKEWKDLNQSIESTGIILYGKYISSSIGGKKQIIIFWDKIEKNRGAFLNRLYGFKIKNKYYKGLIENFSGKKIGKSSVMIPIEHREETIKLLKKYKVNAQVIEVYV